MLSPPQRAAETVGVFGVSLGNLAPPAAPKRANRAAEKKQAARTLAENAVMIADLVVRGNVDPAAAITATEREMIVDPLSQILQSSNTLSKIAGVANPFTLLLGVGIWGLRILTIWRIKHPAKAEKPAPPPAPIPGSPDNPYPPGSAAFHAGELARQQIGQLNAMPPGPPVINADETTQPQWSDGADLRSVLGPLTSISGGAVPPIYDHAE